MKTTQSHVNAHPSISILKRPSMELTRDVVVVVDGGYGTVKAGSNRRSTFISFPSGAAPADQALEGLTIEQSSGTMMINGVPWVAGFETADLAAYDRPIHRRYAMTDHYRALIFEALHRVDEEKIRLLVLGVPTDIYLGDQDQIDHLKTFAGEYDIYGRTISIGEVVVCNQPMGTATACASRRGRVAVVDIGYRTTDTTMLVNGRVDPSGHATCLIASRDVCEEVARLFERETGIPVSADLIDRQFRNGMISVERRMREYDLSADLEAAGAKVGATIWSAIQTTFTRSLSLVDQFLLTGGGAHLLRKQFETLIDGAPVIAAPDPVKANVEGYLQLGIAYLKRKCE